METSRHELVDYLLYVPFAVARVLTYILLPPPLSTLGIRHELVDFLPHVPFAVTPVLTYILLYWLCHFPLLELSLSFSWVCFLTLLATQL